MKELFILRHAKSDWSTEISDDFSRPLSKRGESDAARLAQMFKSKNWSPQAIYSSTALRATMTCETVVGHLREQVKWDETLYLASVGKLLELIDTQHQDVLSVMLVGHNPGLEQLVSYLTPDAARQSNGKLLTTCNLVRIGLKGAWSDISINSAELLDFIRPNDLK